MEKEQKFKTKLRVKKNENNEVLAKLQIARQKINNMEKHNKDLENIRVNKGSLQGTSKQIDANILEVEDRDGFSKCKTQQISKRLQKYGVDSFEVVEGIRRAQNGHW